MQSYHVSIVKGRASHFVNLLPAGAFSSLSACCRKSLRKDTKVSDLEFSTNSWFNKCKLNDSYYSKAL